MLAWILLGLVLLGLRYVWGTRADIREMGLRSSTKVPHLYAALSALGLQHLYQIETLEAMGLKGEGGLQEESLFGLSEGQFK